MDVVIFFLLSSIFGDTVSFLLQMTNCRALNALFFNRSLGVTKAKAEKVDLNDCWLCYDDSHEVAEKELSLPVNPALHIYIYIFFYYQAKVVIFIF